MTHPLRMMRKNRNLRLGVVAKGVGLSEASLSRIERNLQSPSLALVGKLCRYFDDEITANDFMGVDTASDERAATKAEHAA